jgi:DNA repair exonuclease SbcCD nuclease subunit
MKRQIKRPDAILTSDWHLREKTDSPVCRIDNFWDSQWEAVDQVSELQRKYKCPVFHAGDMFHNWKPSPELLSTTKQHIPKEFYTIYGQHDLPQHNFDLRHKSGIYDLEVSGFLTVIGSGSWGQKPKKKMFYNRQRKWIAVLHRFVWDGKEIPWPDCEELTAQQVLKKYPKFDLIVTGDHHKTFVAHQGKRMLVNPGCLTVQDASYYNFEPTVFLWYAEANVVEYIHLKINKEAISREHLEIKKQRDSRMDAFISRLDDNWEVAISFEENLKRFLAKNKIKKSVVKLINKAIAS